MMNKPMKQMRRRPATGKRGPRGGDVRGQIIEAALETLKTKGFNGSSARAIADLGGFNSALIFYYFGSLNGLLLAALDHSSEQRLARYHRAVDAADSLEELIGVATRIYREDVEGGHITVFSELVGASLSHPELAPEIVARAEPWLSFVEETLSKVVKDSPLDGLLPKREIAYAVIAFYMGVNLLTHLDQDRSRIERLFELSRQMAPTVAALLPAFPGRQASPPEAK
jgi:AcrR family transcriptional regulator